MRITSSLSLTVVLLAAVAVHAQESSVVLPISAGDFDQPIHRAYTMEQGLPGNDVRRVWIDGQGAILAETPEGNAVFKEEAWRPASSPSPDSPEDTLTPLQLGRLRDRTGEAMDIRAVTGYGGEFAVAADIGLYLGDGQHWELALPLQDQIRWAPVDVRAVAFDPSGTLWFAAPQGVGARSQAGEWKLFTGAEGLPFNDFTCMATGPNAVWFGTVNGAICFQEGEFSFRQGRRWLLDNHVRDIAVDAGGNAWIATSQGISCITNVPMTLAAKASFYEEEIDRYHRRTDWRYVNPAELAAPGDKSNGKAVFTDNDGHNTGLYLGAVGLGYAVTASPKMKQDAARAFEALAFLSEVTQGGSHPAPRGFIARAVQPVSEPDPNPQFDLAYDVQRNARDALWKIIQPRWPLDETGQWYWKNDSSSDELDGHFFGYAIYYDRVCETEAEKEAVRVVVKRIMDHVLDNGYNLVDHDGLPTRWGHFSPDDLNRNEAWCAERGLNSYSILTYLAIAHHVTGDPKYRAVYLELALEHGYGMNGMVQPRETAGPGTAGQPDDNMALMNFYHLIRYETDPKLLSMYYHAIHRLWQLEKYERSAFANFVYAACCAGKVRTDHWGDMDLSPPQSNYDDAIETLKRYPLDLIDWPMSNAHRIDMVPLQDHLGQPPGAGHRNDGYVFHIDERHEIYWDRDPWRLAYAGNGTRLREGVHYMLAYYMGRVHGFITD